MRALTVAGADLVVVPQAGAVGEWPEGLYEAEMRVAAFQNGYYVALCNRVGRGGVPDICRRVVRLRPGGLVIARAPAAAGVDPLRGDRSGGERHDRTRGACSFAIAGPSCTAGGSADDRSRRVWRSRLSCWPVGACSGHSVTGGVYQTLEEARLAGAIDRGWVPRGCPSRPRTCAKGICRTAALGCVLVRPAHRDALQSLVTIEDHTGPVECDPPAVSNGGRRSCARRSISHA